MGVNRHPFVKDKWDERAYFLVQDVLYEGMDDGHVSVNAGISDLAILAFIRATCSRPGALAKDWFDMSGAIAKWAGRFGVGAELRGQILDRPPILRGSVGPSKAPLAYRPTSSLPNPPGQVSAFKEFVVQVGIVRAARVPSPTWLRPNANTEEEPRYAH